jgi:hypothetical protein
MLIAYMGPPSSTRRKGRQRRRSTSGRDVGGRRPRRLPPSRGGGSSLRPWVRPAAAGVAAAAAAAATGGASSGAGAAAAAGAAGSAAPAAAVIGAAAAIGAIVGTVAGSIVGAADARRGLDNSRARLGDGVPGLIDRYVFPAPVRVVLRVESWIQATTVTYYSVDPPRTDFWPAAQLSWGEVAVENVTSIAVVSCRWTRVELLGDSGVISVNPPTTSGYEGINGDGEFFENKIVHPGGDVVAGDTVGTFNYSVNWTIKSVDGVLGAPAPVGSGVAGQPRLGARSVAASLPVVPRPLAGAAPVAPGPQDRAATSEEAAAAAPGPEVPRSPALPASSGAGSAVGAKSAGSGAVIAGAARLPQAPVGGRVDLPAVAGTGGLAPVSAPIIPIPTWAENFYGQVIGQPGERPAPTLQGTAEMLGKLEQKLRIIADPARPVAVEGLAELVGPLLEFLTSVDEGGEYSLSSRCEVGEDGQMLPPISVSIPASIGDSANVVKRIDALASLLQVHKDLRQPSCKNPRPVGEWVTVQFEEV